MVEIEREVIMLQKNKALKFIEYIINLKKRDELKWIKERYVYYSDELLALVGSSMSPGEIYLNFGKNTSDIEDDCNFNNIFYREEVFEYLVESGYSKEAAFEIMENVRKGKYLHKKLPLAVENNHKEFCDWAAKVMFLPSRKHVFECLYPLNDKFEYLCWE